MKGKIIIVTGGKGDICESVAGVLAAEGAIAVIVGNREDNLKRKKEMEKSAVNVLSIEAGLPEPAVWKKAVEDIIQKYGRIEGLVNNVYPDETMAAASGKDEPFIERVRRNLVNDYLMTHYSLPYLKITKGAIVNINLKTTDGGQVNTSAWSAAYGGRNAMTREWAVELLKYDIRVNAVTVPERYVPSEVAHAAVFLLSEKSGHTTGQLVNLNGSF